MIEINSFAARCKKKNHRVFRDVVVISFFFVFFFYRFQVTVRFFSHRALLSHEANIAHFFMIIMVVFSSDN